jgi:hypothetical protein
VIVAWLAAVAVQQPRLPGSPDSTKPGSVVYEMGVQLRRAQDALRVNDTTTALAAYDSILRANPNDPGALFLRGQLRYDRHDTSGARRDLERSAALGFTLARRVLEMMAHPYTPPQRVLVPQHVPVVANRGVPAPPALMPGHRVIPGQRSSAVLCCPERSWWTGTAEIIAMIVLLLAWRARRPVQTPNIPLQPGERILWDGRPEQRFRISAMDVALSAAGVGVCALVSFFAFTPVTHFVEHDSSVIDWGILLLWVPMFGFIGIVLFFGRYFFDARSRKATRYVVTTERVIVADPNVASTPVADVPDLLVVDTGDGTGTVGFVSTKDDEWARALAGAESGDAMNTPLVFGAARREKVRQRLREEARMKNATVKFEHVEKPRAVHDDILRALRGGSTPAVTEAPPASAPVTNRELLQVLASAQGANRRMGLFACLCLIVFGVAGAAMALPPLLRYLAQQRWTAVPCDITTTQARQTYRTRGQTYETRYRWDASWQYDYGGQHYTGTTFGYTPALDTLGNPEHVKLTSQLAQLKPGQRSTCWIDPGMPSESVIDQSVGRSSLFGLFSLLPLIAGVAGFVYMVRTGTSGRAAAVHQQS